MSSTNRGYDRHISDYYITPKQAIRDFFNHIPIDLIKGDKWLDPCAGGDNDHEMSYPAVIKELFPNVRIITNDIRKDSPAECHQDFTKVNLGSASNFDVVISNPPFYLAKEFVEKGLECVHEGGAVIMLLRLNFLGSKGRKEFFDRLMPYAIYVHHKRMSFTDDGKTDSVEYAHMVWIKGQVNSYSKLYVI